MGLKHALTYPTFSAKQQITNSPNDAVCPSDLGKPLRSCVNWSWKFERPMQNTGRHSTASSVICTHNT